MLPDMFGGVSCTREVRHVVHGRPFGKFGEVKCSWLRVALKGMNELEMDEGEGGGGSATVRCPVFSYAVIA